MKAEILFNGNVQMVDPRELQPADYNPRPKLKHDNPARFEELKSSIRAGIFKPILVNTRTGNIVTGHQRCEAAIDLGLETVPVLYMNVDEKTERRINIADNVEWSKFDADPLQKVLSDLDPEDMSILGMDLDDISGILQDLGEIDDFDDAIDVPQPKPLETLRLIFTTDQMELVNDVLEYVKEKCDTSDPDNPNQNGRAGWLIFNDFYQRYIVTQTVPDGPERRSGDRGEVSL